MPTYEIELSRSALKSLKKLDRKAAVRIFAAVEKLAKNPRPHGVKKLEGYTLWRLRVGDYRVVYDIDDGKVVILVVKVSHRKDVYRK